MSLHKDEVGNKITAAIVTQNGSVSSPFNLTGFTCTFLLQKPDATVIEVEATVVSASRGTVEYAFEADVLDAAGAWNWQAKIVSDTVTLYSQQESFVVHDHLVET